MKDNKVETTKDNKARKEGRRITNKRREVEKGSRRR
jgi:hypothetical protein